MGVQKYAIYKDGGICQRAILNTVHIKWRRYEMIFYTADTHFGHKNILQFEAGRQHFQNVEEMDEALIQAWNQQVSAEDTVYHLGDFGLHCKYAKFKQYLERLNGRIILIQGNHDDSKTVERLEKEGLIELHELGLKKKIHKQVMWLTHYPMEIGERPNKWSIHGHIHSIPSRYRNQLNVGIDSPYLQGKPFGTLVTEDEMVTYMQEQNEYLANERHGR